jgi:hypothetical protein
MHRPPVSSLLLRPSIASLTLGRTRRGPKIISLIMFMRRSSPLLIFAAVLRRFTRQAMRSDRYSGADAYNRSPASQQPASGEPLRDPFRYHHDVRFRICKVTLPIRAWSGTTMPMHPLQLLKAWTSHKLTDDPRRASILPDRRPLLPLGRAGF